VRKPTAKAMMPLIAVVLLLGIAGGFESASERQGLINGYLVDPAKAGGKAALMQAAGEFRVVAANLLWDKVVDRYHHRYMQSGGEWDKNVTILPILRSIVDLDPHFVQAYELMGGIILPRTGHLVEGQQVLAEGIKRNPNEWELYREMAMLYGWTEKRPADALPYAQAGLAQCPDDFSRNLMTRLVNTLQRQIATHTTG
jgi:hypothetical protein